MVNIDARLLDCASEAEITENFNRVLAFLEEQTLFFVTFDSDGGSAVAGQIVRYDGKATEPTDPTKDGKVFGGWFKGTSETAFDFDTKIKEDTALKAHWTDAPADTEE